MGANEKSGNNKPLKNLDQLNNDVSFENPDVDPDFLGHQDDHKLEGKEEVREGRTDNSTENDAMNYKNDRENGAYNPKNI